MNSKFLLFLTLLSQSIFAQDTIPIPVVDSIQTHTQIFSLSPISKRVEKVNGLVFGVGHYDNKFIKKQTINGVI